MPSRKSCSSFWAMFLNTLRRFWPLMLLVFIVMQFLFTFSLIAIETSAVSAEFLRTFGTDRIIFMLRDLPAVSFMMALVAGAFVFMYKFGAKSAGFHHALPARREGHFLSCAAAQLAILFVPMLVTFALLWVVAGNKGLLNAACVEAIWSWITVFSASLLLFSSLAALSAILAGNIIGYAAFYAAINFAVLLGQYLSRALLMGGIFGLYLPHVRSTPLSPLFYMGENSVSGLGYGLHALAGVALFGMALLLYRRQHTEAAGDIVAVRAAKPVLKALAVIFGALAGFYLFNGGYYFSNAVQFPTLVLLTFIFGALGYWIIEMILQKTFRIFSRRFFARLGTAAAAVLVCGALISFDAFGTASGVPDESDVFVAYICVDSNSTVDPSSSIYRIAMRGGIPDRARQMNVYQYDGKPLSRERFDVFTGDLAQYARSILPGVVEDEAGIARLLRLNREIAARESELRALKAKDQMKPVTLSYLLRDGSVVERQYFLPESFEADLIKEIMNQPDMLLQRFTIGGGLFSDCRDFQASLWMGYGDENQYYNSAGQNSSMLNGDRVKSLYEAVLEDAKAGLIGVAYASVDEAKKDIYNIGVDFHFVPEKLVMYGYDVEAYVSKRSENTLRWLAENGFLQGKDLPKYDAAHNDAIGMRPYGGARINIY